MIRNPTAVDGGTAFVPSNGFKYFLGAPLMSALEALEPQDLEIARSSLDAAVWGPFFPEWEFQTLFGLSRGDVREVAAQWPQNLHEPATEAAVLNALTNLYGYPHQQEGLLAGFGLTLESIKLVLDKVSTET